MQSLRVVVAGLIGSLPLAGMTLHYLQYVLGLRDLGYDVLYLEDAGGWYFDPRTDTAVASTNGPIRHIESVMRAHGLDDGWTFVDWQGQAIGISGARLDDFLATTELFIHVSGAGIVRESYLRIPRRVYIDTDPGYIQSRVAVGSERDARQLGLHTAHFSFGRNIGQSDCSIPTKGLTWHPTVQPLILKLWPTQPQRDPRAPFTTIMKWGSYGDGGATEVLGPKETEFARFLQLPRAIDHPLELAMADRPPFPDLEQLGWRCRDSRPISSSIESYRGYIQSSRGEWSVAKSGYVATRSGWFGDRSAAYLASGRPVVLQSTGYERWLPTGEGALTFTGVEEAGAAIEAVNANYRAHCRRARELAESFFDARLVLRDLVETAMET